MKVSKHIRLYCYVQHKWLPKENPMDWRTNIIRRYVITNQFFELGNNYEIARKKNVKINDVEYKYWYPAYLNEDKIIEDDNNTTIEEISIACYGYHGLYQLLPFLEQGHALEFNFTLEFDTDDCDSYDKENFNTVEPIEDPDYTTKQTFWAVNRYDNILMGWKNYKPFWRIDDGHIEWDVDYRAAAALVEDTSLIFPLFPKSKYDDHGVELPYKVTVKIEGKYRISTYDPITKKTILI